MKLQENSRITDGALFVLFISSFILPESTFSLLLLSAGLVGCLVFRFKPTPLSPYFFLAPASIYLAANLLFIYLSNTSGYLKFFSCASLGLLLLSIALKQTYHITGDKYKYRPNRVKLFVILYCCATVALIINSIATTTGIAPLVTKAIQLTTYPVVSAVCLGSLIAIASYRLWLALSLSILYLAYVVITGVTASDFSRLSALDYLLFLLFCILFGTNYFRKSILSGSKLVGYIFGLFLAIQVFALFTFSEALQLGGDALIVDNAIKVLQEAADRHEYMMPIFNGGLIFAPDFLWIESKPKAYNSSAWFIENIMGLNPTSYPWGVGVSLFASSYLYGGLIGVTIIFYSVGIFIGKLSNQVTNPFWAGFLIYFLMRLPYTVFRMDETFMFGSFIPMLFAMLVFIYAFRKKINKAFSHQTR